MYVLNCTDKKFPEIFVEYKGNFKEIGSNFIYVESFPLTYVNSMRTFSHACEKVG
jgi:hypothetical protein